MSRWLALDHPTYEHISGTAIAKVDDSQMVALARQGFTPRTIDQSPWSDRYFIAPLYMEQVPKGTIWQNGAVCLIEVPLDRVSALAGPFRPLDRKVLPIRYWEKALSTYVSKKTLSWDPFIQSLVDEVNTDSLTASIQRLQDFESRLALGDSSYAASEWIRQRFNQYGYAAEFDSFFMRGCQFNQIYEDWPGVGYERNVIAETVGSLDPSTIYIIGGHFDSIVWSDTALARIDAPGADDNGTGVAATLEAARLMAGHSWDTTVQFVSWAAHEVGFFGTEHHAGRADSLGIDIGAMLGLDVIGFMDDAALDCMLRSKDSSSDWLADLFSQAAQTYIPSLVCYHVYYTGGASDWHSFAQRGFPAIGGYQWSTSFFNPYIHTTGDTIEILSPELYTAITKASVATMAILGLHPGMVENVAVRDVGDGDGLVVSWFPNVEADVVGYNVYWGMTSEGYTDSHYVDSASSTADSLTGFTTGSTYYFAVRALDADGRESYVATEVTGVPRVEPNAPLDVGATPIQLGIRLDWAPNTELDVVGYRVYRRINDETSYDTLTVVVLQDTTLTDYPLDGADKYYYTAQAFDASGNASALSEEAYGRPITLDQGIVLVDETRNHLGLPDSEQNAFYDYVMSGTQFVEFEYGAPADRPLLADMGPYSTVVWHADDYSELMAWQVVADLQTYLDAGGNLWFMGWKPTSDIEGTADYPEDFGAGTFLHDYLRVSHVELSGMYDSLQATAGLAGFPDLHVDPEKVPVPSWAGTMRFWEALTSGAPGEDIYTIDMTNDDSPLEGAVCGIRYLGSDFQTVYFGFPLYFMDQEQAREVAQKVMSDFGELPIDEEAPGGPRVSELRLLQNTPNPFSERTTIRYHIPGDGQVNLLIYDIAGRLVRKLITGNQMEGIYTSIWDGTSDEGRPVGNGVYLYRIRLTDRTLGRKLVLIR
jgi:hypothetical protein